MRDWLLKNGGLANVRIPDLISYAYALATKYGEGTAALAAAWYDELAAAAGMILPPAEPAATMRYGEVAEAINGFLNQSQNEDALSSTVSRFVKLAGADTTLLNARRDGAEIAWIPNGDTCAFCIALASRGWTPAGKNSARHPHAQHIHSNCDCTYAIRFSDDTQVAGYDPAGYERMYYGAGGTNSGSRINSMRRAQYAENRDRINAQKRAAYAARTALRKTGGG